MKNTLFIILVILAFGSFISSCTNKKSAKNIFTNSFEEMDGWHESSQLVNSDAHSGNYCIKISPENPYSITFKKQLKDLGIKNISKIKVSAWIKAVDVNSEAKLVVTIDSAESASAFWVGIPVEDYITDANKWVNITNDVTVPNNINKEYNLLIYLWNTGKKPIFMDDISLQFIESK